MNKLLEVSAQTGRFLDRFRQVPLWASQVKVQKHTIGVLFLSRFRDRFRQVPATKPFKTEQIAEGVCKHWQVPAQVPAGSSMSIPNRIAQTHNRGRIFEQVPGWVPAGSSNKTMQRRTGCSHFARFWHRFRRVPALSITREFRKRARGARIHEGKEGLLGLAKGLRARCRRVVKLKGERVPK